VKAFSRHTRGRPKKTIFFHERLIYLKNYKKFMSPSKYSPLDDVHLSNLCFHCSKHVWNSTWMLFSALVEAAITSSSVKSVSVYNTLTAVRLGFANGTRTSPRYTNSQCPLQRPEAQWRTAKQNSCLYWISHKRISAPCVQSAQFLDVTAVGIKNNKWF
jgi:hypothetical protein